MDIVNAEIATVQVGNISLEGLKDEKGNFYVGLRHALKRLNLPTAHPINEVRKITNTTPSTHKLRICSSGKTVLALSLDSFNNLVCLSAFGGNKVSQQLLLDILQISKSIISPQEILDLIPPPSGEGNPLYASIANYSNAKNLTPTITGMIQGQCLSLIYKRVLGCTAAEAKRNLGLKSSGSLRSRLSVQQLKEIETIEDIASRFIGLDMAPQKAVERAIQAINPKRLPV